MCTPYSDCNELMLAGLNIKEATEKQIAKHLEDTRIANRTRLMTQIDNYKSALSNLEVALLNYDTYS